MRVPVFCAALLSLTALPPCGKASVPPGGPISRLAAAHAGWLGAAYGAKKGKTTASRAKKAKAAATVTLPKEWTANDRPLPTRRPEFKTQSVWVAFQKCLDAQIRMDNVSRARACLQSGSLLAAEGSLEDATTRRTSYTSRITGVNGTAAEGAALGLGIAAAYVRLERYEAQCMERLRAFTKSRNALERKDAALALKRTLH